MYEGYRIVVNTAAGRRRYMQWLIPFVVSCEIVDRYDIWVNTHNGADIEFFKRCAAIEDPSLENVFSKINLVWQPDGVVSGISSINAFYLKCVEEKTIYVKLDDDIIWMEPRALENMIRFRIEHPEYFVVSPLVINNALSTYLLHERERIRLDNYYNARADHHLLWRSGDFATQLHEWFLDTKLKNGNFRDLHCGSQPMGMTRFSINCILWFGDEMRKFKGVVPGDDEEFLSCIYPTRQGLANCINGDVIISHFAFFTQREKLDKANILERYGDYLKQEWKNDVRMWRIYVAINAVISYCSEHERELMLRPSPYKKVYSGSQQSWIRKIYHKVVPAFIRALIFRFRSLLKKKSGYRYILQ